MSDQYNVFTIINYLGYFTSYKIYTSEVLNHPPPPPPQPAPLVSGFPCSFNIISKIIVLRLLKCLIKFYKTYKQVGHSHFDVP